jgi:hypothetical protein
MFKIFNDIPTNPLKIGIDFVKDYDAMDKVSENSEFSFMLSR